MMMVYVVVYKNNHLVSHGMRIDDGKSDLERAKTRGYKVRIWEMYGLNHFNELPEETQEEIKQFIKGLS